MIVRHSSLQSLRVSCALGAIALISLLLFYHQQSVHFISPPPPAVPRVEDRHDLLDSVNNGTFGFEKIFVVGLPSRTDRRDGMVLQAAVSDIEINFIDGVRGDTVPDNAQPNSSKHDRLGPGSIGSWRAHMNAIQEIVRRNISSALILEDEVDWDVRIRHQLHDFALSTQALIQPLADFPASFADSTYPSSSPSPNTEIEISFDARPKTIAPYFSPYGDSWDLLWLGHCGMQFPPPSQDHTPQGRVIHKNDETTPERRYLYSFSNPFTLVDAYPEHTRAVHHAQEGACSLAYAVTQQGARRLLQEVALKDVTDAFDILLRFYCEGTKGRRRHLCLASQPGLFHHHRPAGPDSTQSDIGAHGDGFREHSQTDMVRWSTRLNADVLMDGGTVFHDQYPNADVV